MATTIPVPIEFALPAGWQAAPPDEVGAPEAAFVALHAASSKGFTANITLSGEIRTDDADLTGVADEAVRKLDGVAKGVELGRRKELGSEANPGLTQVVRMTVDLKGVAQEVLQMQVFLSMQDVNEPDRHAVIQAVLTATPEQFEQLIGDFQQFLGTLQPEQGRRS